MTCKDCIHSEICLEQYSQLNPDTMFNECKKFKNKADFEEVVYCENCESYNGHRYCKYSEMPVLDKDFCSYGERKVVTDTNVGGK